MKKTKGIKKTKNTRSALRVEALEQRQLLAGITGGGTEVLTNLTHANGNVYDQVLMTGSAVTVTADPGQITRVSFLDLQGDIVQAEFSGAGSLTISMDTSAGAGYATNVDPVNYNQSGVKYVQGLASFTVQGSDASTNVNFFSVGSATAVNQGLFDATHKGGNNMVDAARLTVVANPANPNGSTFGSIFAGNTTFGAATGPVGISAADVHVQNIVRLGDINATGTATPTLIFGANSQFASVDVTGGDLLSANGKAINNNGSYLYNINLVAGSNSAGTALPAQNTYAQLQFTGANPVTQVNKQFTLTASVDTVVGGGGDDTITGTNTTFTALDSIDGAGGTDTINYQDLAGGTNVPAVATISGIEVLNVRSAGAATITSTGLSGLTALNVTQGTSAGITASSGTAVNVTGITGGVVVDGGSSVGVSTSGGVITVGGTTAPGGAITVSHTGQAGNDITLDGGTSVSVTAAGATTGGDITIGGTTRPSGAVTVTSTGAAYNDAANNTLGAVAITGGSTVTTAQTAASSSSGSSTDTSAQTTTQSAVTVTGNGTTSVSVTQSPAVAPVNYVAAVAAGTKDTSVVTFLPLTAGQTTIVGGLTFTAAKALTASEVASAFASLANGAQVGTTGTSSGVYDGALTGFTSGTASADKVTFTSTAFGNSTDIDVDDGTVDPTVSTTDGAGTAAANATAGVMGVVGGMVTITDAAATDTVATVTLDGYGAGSTINSNALTALNLYNSAQAVTVTSTATTLALKVNKLATGANLVAGSYTTINATATGSDSTLDLDAAAVKTLTVAGDKKLTLGGTSTLTVLETVTVSGTAAFTSGGFATGTLKSVDSTATTGTVTVSIDPGVGTYTGGAGVDAVTFVTTTNPTKAASLGAGNDSLALAAGTTASTSTLDGGDGTDTLSMAAADAQTLSATATFQDRITGFEKLSVGQVAAATQNTVDLDLMDDISYVVSAGINDGTGVLNIDNMANGGTLEITTASNAAGIIDVDLTTAAGATDSLNVIITNAGGIQSADLNLAGIETVNITATDTNTGTINTHLLELIANDATTVNVNGNAHLTLTLNAATDSVTLLDGSNMTGNLTATANGVVVQTLKGGSGNDSLAANLAGDTLIGNGGNDTLMVNGKSLVTLTGGAGNDTFDISVATTGVNSYATITDLAAGDGIKFAAGAANFRAAAIVLDPNTAVFQDYANEAINATNTGDVSWFQYNGNTYVVQNVSNGTSFTNGADIIVKITGLVNLGTAAFTNAGDKLVIV